MDPLTLALMQRQGIGGQPPVPTNPQVTPNLPTKIPTEEKRWENAQKIQAAYAGGWAPNPVLLRALLGNK